MTPDAFADTIAAQRAASDPSVSAFVAANAGAGKTRVLTDRVARLLLAGADPSKILCITYTKAAAAEMADRLFRLLGSWALADDARLRASLAGIGAAGGHASARRLFARALETPGGLRIQTIHSFCESVLRRFPIEAGVAPGFAVIDETTSARLANGAIDEAASHPATPELAAALGRLAERCQPDTLREIVRNGLLSRHRIDDARARSGGWDGLLAVAARHLGVGLGDDPEAIVGDLLGVIDEDDIRRAQAALRRGGETCKKAADQGFAAFLSPMPMREKYAALRKCLLTQEGTPKDKFPDAQARKADPAAATFIEAMQEAFAAAQEPLAAAENLADTRAFLTILQHTDGLYRRAKDQRAGLDYDDLVSGVERLFRDVSPSFVRYKLDQSLDHILLDEAQDTSAAQWRVVEGPLQEFFDGGASGEGRTFFAVGDQKQSIYSFQGADADLFAQKQHDLGKKLGSAGPFRNVPLSMSFRSAAPVLDFVDALFAHADAKAGVENEAVEFRHRLKRTGAAGRVELWPLAPNPEIAPARAWDAPLDARAPQSRERTLADTVARAIARSLAGDSLASRGRPVRASDIMILVQTRGPLFQEMIRALVRAGAPVAGADKIALLEEAAIEDLLSYARAALFEADDLSLAEILKSPLFGFDEQSLFDLAYSRPHGATLWSALDGRASERAEWARARDEIAAAGSVGLSQGAFAFLAHVLETGAPSGRRRLYGRLGEAARDGIEELLRQAIEYERRAPRSLQGFLLWAEKNAGQIRREPEQAGDAVRVMTVHGAKGLEAEIVYLLDAHRAPRNDAGPLLFADAADRNVAFVYSPNAASDSRAASVAREIERRRQWEEYRRLLYVAATRARDRLIVCGLAYKNKGDPNAKPVGEKTWHALAEDAFARLGDRVVIRETGDWRRSIKVLECGQDPQAVERAEAAVPQADHPLPEWAARAAAPEPPSRRIVPSELAEPSAAGAAARPRSGLAAFSPLRGLEAQLRGKALHRLLELLPDAPPPERRGLADRLLARMAPAIAEAERAGWREEAMRVIDDPAFAAVFAPGSRAEAAIAGVLNGVRVAGRIDRLAVGPRVLIVDYKTNRPPPARPEDAADAYIAQLALYRALLQQIHPGRPVEAALVWTYEARLAPIPSALLDQALARLFPTA